MPARLRETPPSRPARHVVASRARTSVITRTFAVELSRSRRPVRILTLCQDLLNRPAAVCHGNGPAAAVMHRHLRIDPQALVDGRTDVAGTDGPILDVGGMTIGSAAE